MTDYKELSINELAAMMHQADVRPSIHRLAVLGYVANKRTHPTAEEIFNGLVADYPSMSKTTVYNSLHALTDAGLLRELDLENCKARYDLAPQQPHSHFICTGCGRIFDMKMPGNLTIELEPGFCLSAVNLSYRGLCPECSSTETINN